MIKLQQQCSREQAACVTRPSADTDANISDQNNKASKTPKSIKYRRNGNLTQAGGYLRPLKIGGLHSPRHYLK